MKTLLVLLSLIPVLALAAPATYTTTGQGTVGVCASGTCDAPIEAASLSDGLALSRTFVPVRSVVVTVCADPGQTLSGAGTLTAYAWSVSASLWAAVPDRNLSVTSSGRRCQSFDAWIVTSPVGRVTWVPTGVTVSAGGVSIYIDGY